MPAGLSSFKVIDGKWQSVLRFDESTFQILEIMDIVSSGLKGRKTIQIVKKVISQHGMGNVYAAIFFRDITVYFSKTVPSHILHVLH